MLMLMLMAMRKGQIDTSKEDHDQLRWTLSWPNESETMMRAEPGMHEASTPANERIMYQSTDRWDVKDWRFRMISMPTVEEQLPRLYPILRFNRYCNLGFIVGYQGSQSHDQHAHVHRSHIFTHDPFLTCLSQSI